MPTFVHTADIHLDSPFSARLSSKKAELRRSEQMETFRQITEKAADSNLFLISGDLFDSGFASADTLSFLKRCFESMPQTEVIITAGNHDPLNEKSPYKKVDWSDNVHILSTELEFIDFPQWETRIHGISFKEQYENHPLLTPLDIKEDWCNILVVHGEVVADGGSSAYNPIEKSYLENCGVDYVALGHIHKQTPIQRLGGVFYAYPGIPEGRGFDEDGDKGFICGEIEKGSVNAVWQPSCIRKFIHSEIDISGCNDSIEVLEKLRNQLNNTGTENLYKLSLTGRCRRGLVNIPLFEEHLKSIVFYAEIKDNTLPDYSIEQIIADGGVRADFVLEMQKRIESMDEFEKEIGLKALEIGLAALEGSQAEI